jgi:hypothetical protein
MMRSSPIGLLTQLMLATVAVTMLIAGAWADAAGAELAGFHAEYKLKYSVLGGEMFLDLRQAIEKDTYTYEVRTKALGLTKIFLRGTAIEWSKFRVTATGLRPLHYLLDDGSGKEENKTDIRFDWDEGIAFSEHEGENFMIPIQDGTLDRLSADILVIMDLRAGRTPDTYAIANGDEVDIYGFEALGEEEIKVKAGTFRALKFKRQREGSSRSTLIWYAPDADYLPVRIELQKNGNTVMAMVATRLQTRQH